MKTATASGYEWFVEISNHVGAWMLVLAVAGVSAFSAWHFSHWWIGPVIVGVVFVLLFAEGSFRCWRSVVEERDELIVRRETPDLEVHVRGTSGSAGPPLRMTLSNIRVTNRDSQSVSLTFHYIADLKPGSLRITGHAQNRYELHVVRPTSGLSMPLDVPPGKSVAGDLEYEVPTLIQGNITGLRLEMEEHVSGQRFDVPTLVVWRSRETGQP